MLTLYSWNVNGLRAVLKKEFLAWVGASAADILCLQETKLQAEQLTLEMTTGCGYETYYSHALRKGYSGTGVWVREASKLPVQAVHTDIGKASQYEEFNVEGRITRLDFETFTLFNIYFPNGASREDRLAYKMRFYDRFLAHVTELMAQGKRLVICGDVNTAHRPIDLARPKENEKISGFLPEERAWMDAFLAAGFVDTFRHCHPEQAEAYSWWNTRTRARERNVGWRIDYFFVSQNLLPAVVAADIHPDVMGSDHCPVSLTLNPLTLNENALL